MFGRFGAWLWRGLLALASSSSTPTFMHPLTCPAHAGASRGSRCVGSYCEELLASGRKACGQVCGRVLQQGTLFTMYQLHPLTCNVSAKVLCQLLRGTCASGSTRDMPKEVTTNILAMVLGGVLGTVSCDVTWINCHGVHRGLSCQAVAGHISST